MVSVITKRTGSIGVDGKATLAQLVEQLIRNQQVVGSNPTGGSNEIRYLETSETGLEATCRRHVDTSTGSAGGQDRTNRWPEGLLLTNFNETRPCDESPSMTFR